MEDFAKRIIARVLARKMSVGENVEAMLVKLNTLLAEERKNILDLAQDYKQKEEKGNKEKERGRGGGSGG